MHTSVFSSRRLSFSLGVLFLVSALLFGLTAPVSFTETEAASGTGTVLDSITHSTRSYFGVWVEDDIAYVAEGTDGVESIDISDPDGIPAAAEDTFNTSGEARDVTAKDDCAYVADLDKDEGVVSIDISSPDDLSEADTQATDDDAVAVFLDTEYDLLYVAIGDGGIAIYEVDPDNCDFGDEIVESFDVNGEAFDVFVLDDVAYVGTDDGLVAVDVATPADPEILDTFETDDDALAVFVEGDYAYVAQNSEGLMIVNATDTSALIKADEISTDDDALDVYVSDDIAFMAIGNGGIQTFDVSDPEDISDEDSDDLNLTSNQEVKSLFVVDDVIAASIEEDGFYTIDAGELGGSGSADGDGFPDLDDGDYYVYASTLAATPTGTRNSPFKTIKQALDKASSGDRIIVFPGVYSEDVDITEDEIELIGVGPTYVTIKGSGDTVTVTGDEVTVQGFTIKDGDIGILLDAVDDVVIKNNIIVENGEHGIHADEANGEITNNTIFKNDEDGIRVDSVDDLNITNNIIAENGAKGLYLKTGSSTDIDEDYNLYSDNDDDLEGVTASSNSIVDDDPAFDDDEDDDVDWADRDEWENDFYLDTDSPAIDEGDPSIDDPDDTNSDMGAFGGPESEYDNSDEPADEPGDLKVTVATTTATLTWDDNNIGDERDMYGYYVYKATAAATGPFTQVNTLPVIGTTFAETSLAKGTYYYQVSAIDLYDEESDKSKSVSATIATGTPPPGDLTFAKKFTDFSTFKEFATFIDRLASQAIINGFADNSFRPYNNVTRAELLKMALRGAGRDTSAFATQASTFSDVPQTHSLIQYINFAAANKIVSGQNGKFRPNDPVTRFEATKIILETFSIVRASGATSSFIDVLLPEMVSYIEKAKTLKILSGIGNRFFPNNFLTRAEAAKIISNTMDVKP